MKARWLFLGFVGAVLAGAQVETPVDPFGDNPPPLRVGLIAEPGKSEAVEIQSKWRSIIVPHIEFNETPVEDAIEFLRQRSVELDTIEVDPSRKGIDVVLKTTPGWKASRISLGEDKKFSFDGESPRVTLKLTHVPIGEAFRYVAELAGLEVRIEGYAAVIGPPAEDITGLLTMLAESAEVVAAGKDPAIFPRSSLLEALQSEHRSLELKLAQVGDNEIERTVLEGKLERTQKAVVKARELLLGYWEAERELGEAWQAEIAE